MSTSFFYDESPAFPFHVCILWICLLSAGYCLDPNPDTRPDIFQVSHVAFTLANKQCPVNNIHVSIRCYLAIDLLHSLATFYLIIAYLYLIKESHWYARLSLKFLMMQ